MLSRALCPLLAVLIALALAPGAAAQTGPATSTGSGGAAATVDRLATGAAMQTLRRGGNAVDAAVTAAAVLGVTEPFSCGIGGGGFLLSYDARKGRATTIDHRETAPAAMRPDSFIENGTVLPFSAARYSGLSVGVPGTVEGWETALRRHGTITLAEALAPAIAIARDGFVVDATFVAQTQENLDFFNDVPATAALFLDPDGTPRDVGSIFRNPDLARTLSLIARHGTKAFYRGEIADAIVETVRQPPVGPTSNHTWRPGVMDRARPAQVRRRAARPDARRLPRPRGPRHGPAVERRLDRRRGAEHPRGLSARLAGARGADPSPARGVAATPSPTAAPISQTRRSSTSRCAGCCPTSTQPSRRALIGETAGTSPVAPGDPYPFDGGKPGKRRGQPSVTATRAGSTTHISVTDRTGDVVSYTFTIESTGGAGLVVPGYGFLLNNELTDFNIDSTTHPNRVEPGKRPRSSMSPTIVLRDNRPWLTVGTPGGSMIITTVLQLLTDRIDGGLSLPDAIAAAARVAAQHRRDRGRAGVPRDAGGGRAAGPRPRLLDERGDRRRDGHRVPRRRPRAGGGRAGAPRWRQRDGRESRAVAALRPRVRRTALAYRVSCSSPP